MKWKKLMAMLIVAVFVISSLAVLANNTASGAQYADEIRFEIRTSETTGLGDTATGNLDVFIQSVGGGTYDGISDDWKSQLGTWKSVGGYNNMFLNPTHDKDTGLPVVPVGGQYEFNAFGVQEIRFAVNHLMNRKHIVEDMYNGYATPRYSALGVASPGYAEYFEPVINDLGLTYSGNFQEGYDIVQNAMQDVDNRMENEFNGNYGDVRLDGNDAGENTKWQYKSPNGDWSNIEIISINRIEDARQQVGYHFTNVMNDVGFDTVDKDRARRKALDIAFYTDPAEMEFHAYTGGWLASTAQRFQEIAVNQMYAPWYGFMPGPLTGDPTAWTYENETLDDIGVPLQNGKVPNEEVYWNQMQKMVKTGVKESVRVFLVSTIDFYVYDNDKVESAATDVITGWSSLFGPRTIKLDGTSSATFGQYSATGNLYMDNWNKIGGSSDTYSRAQQDVARDFASYLSPSDGEPIPMRSDWDLKKGFNWTDDDNDGVKETKNTFQPVPNDAIRYNPFNNSWDKVGSGHESAIEVTYTWKKNDNGNLGTFHDGSPITERDIMAWYAFSKELTFNPDDDYFEGRYAAQNKPYYDSIVGIEWGQDDGVFTVYGNYTFPADSKMGSYYGIAPWKPWQINEAAQQMIEDSDVSANNEGEGYGWLDSAENWVHFIGSTQCAKFDSTMQNMKDQNWRPEYLRPESNIPDAFTISDSELGSEIDSIHQFYTDYDHLFDSQGPFKITNVDEANMIIDMERHGTDDGYPLENDYWASELRNVEFEIGEPELPTTSYFGDDIDVGVDQCRIIESYPTNSERLADTGSVRFSLWKGGTQVAIPNDDDNYLEGTLQQDGRFAATIPGEATQGLQDTLGEGTYTVKMSGTTAGALRDDASGTLLIISQSLQPRVENFEVTPTSGQIPLDMFIEATLSNPTGAPVEFPLEVGGTEIDSIAVGSDTVRDISIKHTIDTTGSYTVDLADESDSEILGNSMNVEAIDASGLQVSNLDVGVSGMELDISADIENTGDNNLTADVVLGNGTTEQTIHSVSVQGNNSATISTTHVVDSVGTYKVRIDHRATEVTVSGGMTQFELTQDLQVNTNELNVTVTATVENVGDADGNIKIWAGNQMIANETVAAGQSTSLNVTHEFDSEGDYTISIGQNIDAPLSDLTVDVSPADDTDDDDGDGGDDGGGTPGFTFLLLAISAIVAVLVHKRKKR